MPVAQVVTAPVAVRVEEAGYTLRVVVAAEQDMVLRDPAAVARVALAARYMVVPL